MIRIGKTELLFPFYSLSLPLPLLTPKITTQKALQPLISPTSPFSPFPLPFPPPSPPTSLYLTLPCLDLSQSTPSRPLNPLTHAQISNIASSPILLPPSFLISEPAFRNLAGTYPSSVANPQTHLQLHVTSTCQGCRNHRASSFLFSISFLLASHPQLHTTFIIIFFFYHPPHHNSSVIRDLTGGPAHLTSYYTRCVSDWKSSRPVPPKSEFVSRSKQYLLSILPFDQLVRDWCLIELHLATFSLDHFLKAPTASRPTHCR